MATRRKTEHYVANLHKATFPAMLDSGNAITAGSPWHRDRLSRINAEGKATQGWIGISRGGQPPTTWRAQKPHPDTFPLVARRLGIEPGQCLVFEDTGIGAQASEAAGMQVCVWSERKPVGRPTE